MSNLFAFPPPPQPAVPVADTELLFPVHRVYCVGRNYVEHAKEMGYSGRELPFFFHKPADAVMHVPKDVLRDWPYPPSTELVHHEVELVVAIGKAGENIPVEQAQDYVYGYAVGLDMTRRDLQSVAREQGRPWCAGKGFDLSAPIGAIYRVEDVGLLNDVPIRLSVNGVEKQSSTTSKLIWGVPEIISYLSRLYTLQPGDLIYTGTPEGVGPVKRDDVLMAQIDGLGALEMRVV